MCCDYCGTYKCEMCKVMTPPREWLYILPENEMNAFMRQYNKIIWQNWCISHGHHDQQHGAVSQLVLRFIERENKTSIPQSKTLIRKNSPLRIQ